MILRLAGAAVAVLVLLTLTVAYGWPAAAIASMGMLAIWLTFAVWAHTELYDQAWVDDQIHNSQKG